MESIIFSDDCKGEGKNRKVIFPLHYLRGNRDSLVLGQQNGHFRPQISRLSAFD